MKEYPNFTPQEIGAAMCEYDEKDASYSSPSVSVDMVAFMIANDYCICWRAQHWTITRRGRCFLTDNGLEVPERIAAARKWDGSGVEW
jgi:hypothetical protein